MDKRANHGYVITDQIQVGNKVFVVGESETSPDKFVTWQSYANNANAYDWGHYSSSRLQALEDVCKRALSEINNVKEHSKSYSEKRHELDKER